MFFGAVLFAAAIAAAPAGQAEHSGHVDWDVARETASLATNVDNAVKACDIHVTQSPDERATQKLLEAKGIKFGPEAPDYIQAVASGRFGPARYHRWIDPHAEIWLVAYTGTEACRVMVVNSTYAAGARAEVERLLQVDDFWKKDESLSGQDAAYWTSVFRGTMSSNTGIEALMKLQGKLENSNDAGFGLQMSALIALARKQ